MPALKYIDRLKRINKLIRLQATGTPKKLAARLGISERLIYHYVNDLRKLGAPVEYSSVLESYIYLDEGHLDISYKSHIKEEPI